MKDLTRISEENVIQITRDTNQKNKIIREVVQLISPYFTEDLIGKKIRAVSKNTFTANFPIKKHARTNEYAYSLFFGTLGYLHLRININNLGIREITILKTDNSGIVARLMDFKEVGKEYYNELHQVDLVNKIADLQKEIEHLLKGLNYSIYG